jgi:pimeloyl-ACP methyl ester carboxylesterase
MNPLRRIFTATALCCLALAGCQTPGPQASAQSAWAREACLDVPACLDKTPATLLELAQRWERRGRIDEHEHDTPRPWLHCAALAYLAMAGDEEARAAGALATRCTDAFLERALAMQPHWPAGTSLFDGLPLQVEPRGLSPDLQSPLELTLARQVSMAPYNGERHARPGFGVPLAVVSPRCNDAPRCHLQPPEGVARNATAWIEVDRTGVPRLVLADALSAPRATVQGRSLVLAADTSAAWARLASTSPLKGMGIFGLLGGDEIGKRAGVYLLEDYDPHKQPLVMIHGLGSSPLIWAHLSNAVWGDPVLRARFQVWHVVYQSDAPPLILRLRVQKYLDDAWQALDPEGDDPARAAMTLVGHSLGGIIARMLSADSGTTLWDTAFNAPPEALRATPEMRTALADTFRFSSYPGITRVIFMAVPHRGSPSASAWLGRVMGRLVGRRVPEIRSLQKIANANPEAVQPALRESYLSGWVNSIFALRLAQPVRKAGEALMPRPGIRYHTIAGVLPGRAEKTDGVVPLDSALLDGADSTLVLEADHQLYRHPAAVAEVLRILRGSLPTQSTAALP